MEDLPEFFGMDFPGGLGCCGRALKSGERKISRNFFGFQCVQEMGNGKANRLYEAYLPENFRRPQTDQHPFSLEKHGAFPSWSSVVKPP